MRVIQVAAGLVFLAVCSVAMGAPEAAAQAAAAPAAPTAQPARFGGEITAVTASQMTVRGADGNSTNVTIAADGWLLKTRPIQASDIKAGDFVATANTNNADGTGTSTELRVFPEGMHVGEGSYPMQQPNTTMTNATVAQVTSVGADRQLTVTYGASAANGTPAGTRTITLPASVQVIQWYRVPMSEVHVGERARGRGTPGASGAVVADFAIVDAMPAPAPAAH